jgi:hypothetical protein
VNVKDPGAALKLLRERLVNTHGFLGASLFMLGRETCIGVSWLEFDPIPALPAKIRGTPVVVFPRTSAAAKKHDAQVSGSWLDTWKQAGRDAWQDYSETLKSYWS